MQSRASAPQPQQAHQPGTQLGSWLPAGYAQTSSHAGAAIPSLLPALPLLPPPRPPLLPVPSPPPSPLPLLHAPSTPSSPPSPPPLPHRSPSGRRDPALRPCPCCSSAAHFRSTSPRTCSVASSPHLLKGHLTWSLPGHASDECNSASLSPVPTPCLPLCHCHTHVCAYTHARGWHFSSSSPVSCSCHHLTHRPLLFACPPYSNLHSVKPGSFFSCLLTVASQGLGQRLAQSTYPVNIC